MTGPRVRVVCNGVETPVSASVESAGGLYFAEERTGFESFPVTLSGSLLIPVEFDKTWWTLGELAAMGVELRFKRRSARFRKQRSPFLRYGRVKK